MAWLGTWKYRRKITIDSSKIDTSDLSHFPVTVFLNTTAGSGDDDVSDIFDELTTNDNRKKIALTTSDGETQLYAEIEKWDDANEQAILHVSKSGWTLANASDTELYIYFDSSQSDNTTYIADIGARTEVWDSNFKMVQHMVDTTTSTITDSTSNNNDGTKGSAGDPLETDAKIGKGQDFSSDHIDCGDGVSLDITSAITLEGWIKLDSLGALQMVITRDDGSNRNFHLGIDENNHVNAAFWTGGAVNNPKSVATLETGTYYYIAATYDSTTGRTYRDGAADGTDTSPTGAIDNDNVSLTLGAREDGADRNVDGILDEIRVSASVRAANWIKATYNSGMDTLIKDYAAKETYSAPSAFIPKVIMF